MKTIVMIRNSRKGDIGGAEKYPIIAGNVLKSQGFRVIIMSSNPKTLKMAEESGLEYEKSPWWSFQNFSGLKIFLFPAFLVWQTYLFTWYLYKTVGYKADVIYPQSRDDFIAASFAARLLRKKVIWTDHADLKHIYMNHSKWYKNPVGKLVFLASKYAHTVAIESKSEKKLIEKSLNKALPKNYSVIHIGVVRRKIVKINRGPKITLISTSRLVKDKGMSEMIEAFTKIKGENLELNICGDGADAEYFKKLAHKDKRIVFKGHIEDVYRELARSDILIHPTYHEGFGLSLVEAESCGLPIIATRVGSIPEIVEDNVNGLLVPSKNIEALESAMRKLISDEKLRLQMGKSGYDIFIKNFQLDKIVTEKLIPLMY